MPRALEITGLTKRYANGIEALKGIDLTVEDGEFFALLGPNGAGKSTTIGILCSLVNRTAGTVTIYGHDLDRERTAAKHCIGVVPQDVNLSMFDKVLDTVVGQGCYYGLTRREALASAERYLTELQLWDRRNEIARNLSGGMKRRLMIARALVHQPRLLILDEPTAGVDIEIRRGMWKFLAALNAAGTTIILTTHYLEEAEQLCRRVAIIDHGRIVLDDAMANVVRRLEFETFCFTLADPLARPLALALPAGTRATPMADHELEIEVPRSVDLNGVFAALGAAGLRVLSMRNKSNRLEELFLRLVDRGAGQAAAAGADVGAIHGRA